MNKRDWKNTSLTIGAVILGSASAIAGSACGTEPESSTPSPSATYYRDLKPLIDERCVGCHHDGGIAPFALTTFEQVSAMAGPIKAAVESHTMPPWLADDACNDYAADRSLTDDEVKKVTGWIEAGAVAGDPSDAKVEDDTQAGLSRVDRTLSMQVDYTPQLQPDDYRCFLLDWPEDATKFVTGFRANPGNPATVHHVIAYLIPPSQVAKYNALEAEDDAPGYSCFGGPGGGIDTETTFIGSWAPGAVGGDLPAGTGLKVVPGSKIALQVHYNTLNSAVTPDRTSIDLKLDDTVAKEGHWQFFTNLAWVAGQGMDIPPMTKGVSYDYSIDPTPFVSQGKPFTLYATGLHMHTKGRSAELAIERAHDGEQCLLSIPQWNFHWQLTYQLAEPTVFNPGDKLSISCTWDNDSEKGLSWGEGTGDEMCLGLVYYTL